MSLLKPFVLRRAAYSSEDDNLRTVYMAKRKAISARTRFEIFKRDSFKCQYCGKSSPGVVLHIDHIKPVADGGDNDLTNLVTACQSCNLGKSDIPLSDKSAVSKQKAMLDELNERREQMAMMMEWRDELKNINEEWCRFFADRVIDACSDECKMNENGMAKIRKAVSRFGVTEVADAIGLIIQRKGGVLSIADAGKLLDDIAKVCGYNRMPEGRKRLSYIAGILKNRLSYFSRPAYEALTAEAIAAGYEIDEIEQAAKTAKNWTQFKQSIAVDFGEC